MFMPRMQSSLIGLIVLVNVSLMKSIEQAVIKFFEQAAQKDSSLLQHLALEQRFIVSRERWSFTLPDLFAYLQQQVPAFSGIDYRQFRKIIFNSPINQAVKSHGAEIIIADNQSMVDKSSYALVWHAMQ